MGSLSSLLIIKSISKMKKVFIIILLGFQSFFLSAQFLKIETGITSSKLDWIIPTLSEKSYYDKLLVKPSISVGIDYLNKKHFNLSSNVGYMAIGGSNRVTITDLEGKIIEENKKLNDFATQLTFNTSFEIKYPIKNITPFILIGGFYNLNLKLSNSFEALEEITEIHNLYGVLSGLGVKLKIKKSEFGIKGQLYSPLNNLANWNTSFSNNNSISAKAVNVNLFYSYPI